MIEFDSACDDGEYIWFVGKNDSILYRMNREYGVEPIVLVSNEKGGFRETPNCVKYLDKIICLPDRGNRIVIYDLISRNFNYIEVDISGRASILNAYVYNNALWCVSYSTGEVLKCDINRCVIEQRYKVMHGGINRFNGEAKLVGNILYLVDMLESRYIEFNLDTLKKKVRDINGEKKGFSTISIVQDKVYLTGYNNIIYCCDSEKCSNISLDGKLKWLLANENAVFPRFNKSYVCSEYIVFLPLNSRDFLTDEFVALNINSMKISTYHLNTYLEREIDKNISLCYIENGCICIHDEMLEELTYIDLSKEKVTHNRINKEKNRTRSFVLTQGAVYQESDVLNLTDFIDLII